VLIYEKPSPLSKVTLQGSASGALLSCEESTDESMEEFSEEWLSVFSPQPTAAQANAQERESKNAIKYFFIITPLKNINYKVPCIVYQGKIFDTIPLNYATIIIQYFRENNKKKRAIFIYFSLPFFSICGKRRNT
jgi:hypothetical protein